jgi:hypothetical protein
MTLNSIYTDKILKTLCSILLNVTPKRTLGLIATIGIFFFSLAEFSLSLAQSRYYISRPNERHLPTGCQPGTGPQYQSFDPRLGSILEAGSNGQRDLIIFHPVQLCRAAADICAGKLTGPQCCINACRQLHNVSAQKFDVKTYQDPGYEECVSFCPNVPSFTSTRPELKNQLIPEGGIKIHRGTAANTVPNQKK